MYSYVATLTRVIDGDTVVLDLDLGFYLWRRNTSYRLARINAPELSTAEGVTARTALVAYLAGKKLTATTTKPDKYGRSLVDLYADTQDVNDWMLTNGYAVPYTG